MNQKLIPGPEARTAYEAGLRALIRSYLTYNPLLSDKDREDMGLPVHKTTHTHAPIAADPPDIELDTSVPGRVSFHYYGKGSASTSPSAGKTPAAKKGTGVISNARKCRRS